MQEKLTGKSISLIYDGDCPLCRQFAKVIKIKESIGTLSLINARDNPSIVALMNQKGFNLDAGIVIQLDDCYYHGADAMQVLALISSHHNWLNKLNYYCFRSKWSASILYPVLRAFRNCLLKISNKKSIHPSHPINKKSESLFKEIFAENWSKLPIVLQKHFANRPFSTDSVRFNGTMDILCIGRMKYLLPFFKLFHVLVPYSGKAIPVSVLLKSKPHSNALFFEREFLIPNHKPYFFQSYLQPLKNKETIEFLFLGVGWRSQLQWQENKIIFIDKGYAWKLFNLYIPLPLQWFFGKVAMDLKAISNSSFELNMVMTPFFFGKYIYKGVLTLTENRHE